MWTSYFIKEGDILQVRQQSFWLLLQFVHKKVVKRRNQIGQFKQTTIFTLEI